MGLKKFLVSQVRKPKGFWGRRVARRMNRSHAELARWGISHLSIAEDYKILDIGCGGGANVNSFAKMVPQGKVIGIDYSEASVKMSKDLNKEWISKGRVEIFQESVSQLPFAENKFDLVTGFEAYYFWPDLVNDLKGILKVIKPGGLLALINEEHISDNKEKLEKSEMWANLGNFTIHSPPEYKDFLTSAGFSEVLLHEELNEGWIVALAKKE